VRNASADRRRNLLDRMFEIERLSILTGATAERFESVKWFYLEADDDTGYDAATDLIARALANLHPALTGPTDNQVSAERGRARSA
jgi:hypothetical protein